MKKVTALLLVLAASAAFTAACSKSSQSSTGASPESSPMATAMATTGAMATSMGTMAMASGAMASAAALPIPLAKLPNAKVAAGNVAAGAKVFAANCESCHGAGGKNGTVGPTLFGTGLKAGQVAYMVLNPTAIDKESGMPKLPLSAKDVADVAAYVASLK